jgi:hypothetical protein
MTEDHDVGIPAPPRAAPAHRRAAAAADGAAARPAARSPAGDRRSLALARASLSGCPACALRDTGAARRRGPRCVGQRPPSAPAPPRGRRRRGGRTASAPSGRRCRSSASIRSSRLITKRKPMSVRAADHHVRQRVVDDARVPGHHQHRARGPPAPRPSTANRSPNRHPHDRARWLPSHVSLEPVDPLAPAAGCRGRLTPAHRSPSSPSSPYSSPMQEPPQQGHQTNRHPRLAPPQPQHQVGHRDRGNQQQR